MKVSLRHTQIRVGLGHHLLMSELNSQLKIDFTHNIFPLTREARSCFNANTRFSCLHCLHEFGSPNPTSNQTAKHQQEKDRKQLGSSSSRESVIQIRRCGVHFNSDLSFAFRAKDFVISKTSVAEHKHFKADLDS